MIAAVGDVCRVGGHLVCHIAREQRGRAAAVVLSLTLVCLIFINMKWRVIDVRWAKGQALPNEIFVKWNPISRIALVKR